MTQDRCHRREFVHIIINPITTIVMFLMVALLQNTQKRPTTPSSTSSMLELVAPSLRPDVALPPTLDHYGLRFSVSV